VSVGFIENRFVMMHGHMYVKHTVCDEHESV